MMNGFYSVEVTLPDNRPLYQMILFNNKNLLVYNDSMTDAKNV